MMGARQFDLMKPEFLSHRRHGGALCDMNQLVRALDSERITGGGVDVTDPKRYASGGIRTSRTGAFAGNSE